MCRIQSVSCAGFSLPDAQSAVYVLCTYRSRIPPKQKKRKEIYMYICMHICIHTYIYERICVAVEWGKTYLEESVCKACETDNPILGLNFHKWALYTDNVRGIQSVLCTGFSLCDVRDLVLCRIFSPCCVRSLVCAVCSL